ncbi:ABC transporter permease, partial [Mesotoga sp.]|uniref:ABC transporter permease n=1 Tax=Mesotoga sp. TaxID=2053577 RepID=UPI00356B341B
MIKDFTGIPKDEFEFVGEIEEKSEALTRPSISFWKDVWRRLFKNKVAMTGLIIILAIALFSIIIPELSSYSYSQQNLRNINAAPSSEHWFGTDSLGRDLWVRTWVGARVSLAVGIFGSIIPSIIGIVIGGISGYFGGKVDMIIMRLIDIIICIPQMIYIILIMLVIGSGPVPLIIAFAITGWMGSARNVRGLILKIKQEEFVLASRILGAPHGYIIFKHLVPNTLGIVVVSMTLGVPAAIFQEA